MSNFLLKTVFTYIGLIVFFTLIYILLSNIDLMNNLSDVFYYKMCFILVITFILCFTIIYFTKSKFVVLKIMSVKDVLLALIFAFLLNFSFLSLILVSLDRSISVYLISYMAAYPERTFTKDDMESIFWKGYIKEYEAMDRRIKEQLVTGTIEPVTDESYRITHEGVAMVGSWKLFAKLFPIDERFLYPEEYLSDKLR